MNTNNNIDNDAILESINNADKKKKKIFIIIGVAISLTIFVTITIILWKPKNKDTAKSNNDYDTSLIGDAQDDPENAELTDETGVNVDASKLVAKKDKTNGIDVSKWQGKIDWKKVKENGIQFAFIRIGYRGENGIIYKDDNADYNIQQAQKNNILVGVYFFSTATSKTEAVEEAQWTAQAIAGYSISYPVVYDCEGFDRVSSRMFSLSKEERTSHALAFLKKIKDYGYEPMFYGALNEIKGSAHWNIKEIEKNYKIWVAQYPDVTYPEKDAPDYNRIFHAWQYTNKGKVDGIFGNVDMVVCYFKVKKANPKDKNANLKEASTPLSDEEKLYKAVNETVTAKEETNLRTAPTTKSNIVVLLKNGEAVTRIGIGSNGWSKLQYKGQVVYAITNYLTTDFGSKPSTNDAPTKDMVSGQTFTGKYDSVTAKDEVNLRALPTTDSAIIGKLVSGNFLTRTAVSDKGWSRLQYNGQIVYCITSYLSNEIVNNVIPETPATSSDGFQSVDEQVTAKSETNLRTAPSTQNSQVVYLLKNGEYVRRIGIHSNGWSKLEYNGQVVYAISSYLTN